jgi:hypothetical protein
MSLVVPAQMQSYILAGWCILKSSGVCQDALMPPRVLSPLSQTSSFRHPGLRQRLFSDAVATLLRFVYNLVFRRGPFATFEEALAPLDLIVPYVPAGPSFIDLCAHDESRLLVRASPPHNYSYVSARPNDEPH